MRTIFLVATSSALASTTVHEHYLPEIKPGSSHHLRKREMQIFQRPRDEFRTDEEEELWEKAQQKIAAAKKAQQVRLFEKKYLREAGRSDNAENLQFLINGLADARREQIIGPKTGGGSLPPIGGSPSDEKRSRQRRQSFFKESL
jgi:hypothetical protein